VKRSKKGPSAGKGTRAKQPAKAKKSAARKPVRAKSKPAKSTAKKPVGAKKTPAKARKSPAKNAKPRKSTAKARKPAARKATRKRTVAKEALVRAMEVHGPTAGDGTAMDAIRVDAPLGEALGGERRHGGDDGSLAGKAPQTGKPLIAEEESAHPDDAADEVAETPQRANKLVPTNAVHTTKRRMKRSFWQNQTFAIVAAAAVVGLLFLGNRSEPPDVSPLERTAGTGSAKPTTADVPQRDTRIATRRVPERTRDGFPVQIRASKHRPPTPVATRPAVPSWDNGTDFADRASPQEPRTLGSVELMEIERMLARLDLDPSDADGVVDQQTESAIRLYQQIAGLPVDGTATVELLHDMREVVKLLDGDD